MVWLYQLEVKDCMEIFCLTEGDNTMLFSGYTASTTTYNNKAACSFCGAKAPWLVAACDSRCLLVTASSHCPALNAQ